MCLSKNLIIGTVNEFSHYNYLYASAFKYGEGCRKVHVVNDIERELFNLLVTVWFT